MTKYIDGYVCAFGDQRLCFASSLTVSDWASWVQAIGSICAILASALVVWWQVRRQHRLQVDHLAAERRHEELRRIRGYTQVLGLAQHELVAAGNAFRDQDMVANYAVSGYQSANWDLMAAALDQVDPSQLASASLDLAFRAARKEFHVGLRSVNEGLKFARAGLGGQPSLNRHARIIDECQRKCASHTGRLIERANALAAFMAHERATR